MKKTAILTLFAILVISFFLDSCDQNSYPTPERQEKHKIPQESIQTLSIEKSTVANFVGKSNNYLTKRLGAPDRIEPSAYGYDWYVYSSSENQYMQAGIKDNKVVTVFVAGDGVPIKPFKIGQSVTSLLKEIPVKSEVTVNKTDDFFRFELSEDEMNTRPLIPFHDIYAQLYFDKFTQELSSIRYLDKETLLMQRPYSVVYRGSLEKQPVFSEKLKRKIEKGQEQQILDITNVIRLKHGLAPLEKDSKTAKVAYNHSKEMEELNYFSHTSPASGDLAERLEAGKVKYTQAGENIAAKYTDGPAAVEGWLNSQGHREALLNKNYTRLGVGVYGSNYTQNFIKPR
ncbi:CAP domain-containing protein [Fictibacillus sp. FJAT-27399]|uniref:CAP domain-containing protein n=1 Tax=Fictibacillus sp. FJAT-27399 TaxID=1729689 RepID=UPI000785DEA6|nr:CAP domain-containing protein [Fictibacillus sp. FJAT-27399]